MCHVTTDQDLSFSMAVRSHGQWWCSPALHLWLVSRLLDSRPVHRQHRAVHMSAVSAPKLCQPGIQIHFSPQSRLNLVLKFLDTHKLNMLMDFIHDCIWMICEMQLHSWWCTANTWKILVWNVAGILSRNLIRICQIDKCKIISFLEVFNKRAQRSALSNSLRYEERRIFLKTCTT